MGNTESDQSAEYEDDEDAAHNSNSKVIHQQPGHKDRVVEGLLQDRQVVIKNDIISGHTYEKVIQSRTTTTMTTKNDDTSQDADANCRDENYNFNDCSQSPFLHPVLHNEKEMEIEISTEKVNNEDDMINVRIDEKSMNNIVIFDEINCFQTDNNRSQHDCSNLEGKTTLSEMDIDNDKPSGYDQTKEKTIHEKKVLIPTADHSTRPEDLMTKLNEDNNHDKNIGVEKIMEEDPHLKRKNQRKLRRERLRRIIKKCDGNPSFTRLLNVDLDVSDDEHYFSNSDNYNSYDSVDNNTDQEGNLIKSGQGQMKSISKKFRISIDAELGLGASNDNNEGQKTNDGSSAVTSSDLRGNSNKPLSPSDEGWYEGSVSMALPDDGKYLPTRPIHHWIRSNLEFFSATDDDIIASQIGRRHPVARGRVGIRCIHCAKMAASTATKRTDSSSTSPLKQSERLKLWPAGSVSYPNNIACIYSACSQKVQNHFMDNCPNLPAQIKSQMLYLSQQPISPLAASSYQQRVPASLYYIISAKQFGLVDVPKNGIRFGRDISLEPLPYDTIRTQVEADQQQVSQRHAIPTPPKAVPLVVSSQVVSAHTLNTAVVSVSDVSPAPVLSSPGVESRVKADKVYESVLAEAVAEADDHAKYIGRSQDKALVSDYIFLIVKQMQLCRAVSLDFTSRGKKSKSMQVGFAGFNCRWCQLAADINLHSQIEKKKRDIDVDKAMEAMSNTSDVAAENITAFSDTSCRSFPSVVDNLSSSITNSFVNHLSKCENLPDRIKKAISAYKNIHQRQMSQLPYGSQRGLIHEIWRRLREADKTEEQMNDVIAKRVNGMYTEVGIDVQTSSVATVSLGYREFADEAPLNRPGDFPCTNDIETQNVLNKAEESWDLEENDKLIVPSDRNLVSDYVFLTMRQTRIIFAEDLEASKLAQNISPSDDLVKTPGIACLHCYNREQTDQTYCSRTFISKADCLSSALNISLYNHMQACVFIPKEIKQALEKTRKLHSEQCSRIKYGSQRRFFNNVFSRLEQARFQPNLPRKHSSKDLGSVSDRLTRNGFIIIPRTREDGVVLICKHCRRLPVHFRARCSILFSPDVEAAHEHSLICRNDCINLEIVADAMEKVINIHHKGDITVMDTDSFRTLIHAAIGEKESLTRIFTSDVKTCLLNRRMQVDTHTKSVNDYIDSPGLWKSLLMFEEISSSLVDSSFSAFAKEFPHHDFVSTDLKDNTAWVDFLLLISPSLLIP